METEEKVNGIAEGTVSLQLDEAGTKTGTWKAACFASEVGPEKELQRLLRDHPEILPWKGLGLVSALNILKDEVATVDGKFIDHLAVDDQGHVYIFECKIVTNHEMRSVIAQALEYAGQLSSLTTLSEFLSAVNLTPDEVTGSFGPEVLSGLRHCIRQADYRVLIVTDHAGNSAQARVNRKTVEYLRSSTEIHLVEIAKFVSHRGERLFVPHITAGGGPVDRSQRQLEVWKRNAFLLLKDAPELHPALLDYVGWLEEFNSDGTKVTPTGTLSSTYQGHYLAYIEPYDEGFLRLWISAGAAAGLSPDKRERWDTLLQQFEGKLGPAAGSNYYRVDLSSNPSILRNHLELQQQLAGVLAGEAGL